MNQQSDNASSNDNGMHKGNWVCGSCGAPIEELPFEPDEDRLDQLLCRDCHQQRRAQGPKQKKQMHEGDWECANCGTAINKLPFKPDPNRLDELRCFDCYQQSS